jgi:hypothetical protein
LEGLLGGGEGLTFVGVGGFYGCLGGLEGESVAWFGVSDAGFDDCPGGFCA